MEKGMQRHHDQPLTKSSATNKVATSVGRPCDSQGDYLFEQTVLLLELLVPYLWVCLVSFDGSIDSSDPIT
mgnify:CR=1 FL=1